MKWVFLRLGCSRQLLYIHSKTDGMPEAMDLDGALRYCINSISVILLRLSKSTEQAKTVAASLKIALWNGDTGMVAEGLETLSGTMEIPQENKEELFVLVLHLSRCVVSLRREEVPSTDVEELVNVLGGLISLGVLADHGDMLYNLAEVGCQIGKYVGMPVLYFAEFLCRSAKIDDPDQYPAALWHYASEQVSESLQKKEDWLKAIDAVEVALTVRAKNDNLQALLDRELGAVLKQTADTPLWPLFNAFAIMGGLRLNAAMEKEILKQLAGLTGDFPDTPETWTAMRTMAMMRVQNDIDDERFSFLSVQKKPGFSWHNFMLDHQRLTGAVPLGMSLIVDINRTAEFLLDLVHEITHAFSLIGSIGKIRNALRVASHFCEIALLPAFDTDKPETLASIRPADQLPEGRVYATIAALQLEIAYKSSVLQAIWRPWLEGVAVYFELLADPSKDEAEISCVFEAIRSLIDFDIPMESGETMEDYAPRASKKMAKQFEDFCSQCYDRLSALKHKAYARIKDHKKKSQEEDIYLLGYLMVRSVVSKWEHTLGRRLEPARAAKLLLHFTRGDGNGFMVPDLRLPASEFRDFGRDYFSSWLTTIAALDKAILEEFLRSPEQQEASLVYNYLWRDGQLVAVAPEEHHAIMVAWVKAIEDQTIDLLSWIAPSQDGFIRDLLFYYWDLLTLLPIGNDMAKVNLEKGGFMVISPRTFVGLQVKNSDDPAYHQRYSVGRLPLPGREEEAKKLQRLLGRQRLARVLATRVVDLIGNPASPLGLAGASYVCFLIESQWQYISYGYPGQVLTKENSAFIQLLQQRLNPAIFFEDEINNLASLDFFGKRMRESGITPDIAGVPETFDATALAREVGLHGCSAAFDSDPPVFDPAFLGCRQKDSNARELGRILHETGLGKVADTPLADEALTAFTDLIFDKTSYSGIKPFTIWHK